MRFIDVEGGWIHRFAGEYDIPSSQIIERSGSIPLGDIKHGTAVLGIVIGKKSRKFSGIANGLNTTLVSKYDNRGVEDIYNALLIAMYKAVENDDYGNVILLEIQIAGTRSPENVPVETNAVFFRLIKTSTYCLQTIVVEPAANNERAIKLDTFKVVNPYGTSPASILFGSNDSGALIVSSTNYGCDDNVLNFTRKLNVNYGSRVDSFVWGQNVYSLDATTSSLISFNNTSASSAIIAGLIGYIQSNFKHRYATSAKPFITPEQMKALLKNNNLTASGSGSRLFTMPNLVNLDTELVNIISPTPRPIVSICR